MPLIGHDILYSLFKSSTTPWMTLFVTYSFFSLAVALPAVTFNASLVAINNRATDPGAWWPTNHAFVAYGDSYAAGIGAGNNVRNTYDLPGNCYLGSNAYAYKIRDDLPHESFNIEHVACTGAVLADVNGAHIQRDQNQIALVQPLLSNVGWATLSIGGNDAGFADIASDCLLYSKPDHCTTDKQKAQDTINDFYFAGRLAQLYLDVVHAASNDDFLLVVTGYQQFFSVADTFCDNHFLFRGAYLTQALRGEVNALVRGMNDLIQNAIKSVNEQLAEEGTSRRVVYFDTDSLFETHRFCEAGKTGNDWYRAAWFFTIYGDDLNADGTTTPFDAYGADDDTLDLTVFASFCQSFEQIYSPMDQLVCDYAVSLSQGGPTIDGVGTTAIPRWIMKVFHPRSAGHAAIGQGIADFVRQLPQSGNRVSAIGPCDGSPGAPPCCQTPGACGLLCSCNDNACSATSPACCANGSCP